MNPSPEMRTSSLVPTMRSTVILWEPPSLRRPSPRLSAPWRAKRQFDLLILLLFAPFWVPALLLIAAAIKIASPRTPALFTQTRIGRHGRRFQMYKFRTMLPEAEELKSRLRRLNELPWPDFKVTDDPRVTRLGRFLRRTSLDELPQLLNVLRGEMSLVGPRPTSFSDSTYALWQRARLDAQPGITGPWQVDGRGSYNFDRRTRLDIDYIRRRSLLLDLKILLRTIGVVVRRKGGC